MNRIAHFGILALAVLPMISCIKLQEQKMLKESIELTITATREGQSPDTKTARLEDGSVVWSPADEISFFYGKGEYGGSRFTSQNTEQAAIVEFKGRVEGVSGGGEDYVGDNYFWAVYPYSSSASCDGESVTTSLSAFQTATEGSFANNLFTTVARSKGLEMAFYNVCGGVKFTVSRSDITMVRFKGNADENLAGSVRVAFNESGKPEVTEVLEGKKEVTVYAPGGGTFEAGKTYYIVLLPAELSAGFTMTFRTSDSKEGAYVRTDAVSVPRSNFGVLSEPDKVVSTWEEVSLSPGGGNSGIYLGIIGFNDDLYPYPISALSTETKDGFNSFIEGLSMKNGTLLYYSVDQVITTLQSTTFPDDLFNVAIVTFTDGLDQGSMMKSPSYGTEDAYLSAIQDRLAKEKVSGQDITAYSIGVWGSDITDESKFKNNLNKLASSSNNVYEVSNMDELNTTFQDIADQLDQTCYVQKVTLRIPGQENGKKIRFTFDNITDITKSQIYIEGVFDLSNHSLTNIVYHGLTCKSGETVAGAVEGINVTFVFQGVRAENNTLISKDYIKCWTYIASNNSWQINSEYDMEENGAVVNEKKSAAIMLALDCSSSLGDDFATMKEHAKAFVTTLGEPKPEDGPDDPTDYPSDHYSTKPIDLSLAVVRDSIRYYVTKAEYANMNMSEYIIEGLAVVTGEEKFIIALQNETSLALNHSVANELFDCVFPTYEQGLVISARLYDINNALGTFGGSSIYAYDTYYGYSAGTWTSYTETEDDVVKYYYINYAGGKLDYTTDTTRASYLRQVFPIDTGTKIHIHSKSTEDLTLAVTDGQNRIFQSYAEYKANGIPEGYSAEGVAVCSRLGNFIIALRNASSNTLYYHAASELYGDSLPSRNHGLVISARLYEINAALGNFGGSSIYAYDTYYGYSAGTWTSYTETEDDVVKYYYINYAGGKLDYTTDTNSVKYVRQIVGTF